MDLRAAMHERRHDGYYETVTWLEEARWVPELTGFREFLILKLGGGDNLTWRSLVEELAEVSRTPELEAPEQQIAMNALSDLLQEFLAEMRWHGAIARLYHEYWHWRRMQWPYSPELVREATASDSVSVDEAADSLAMTRRELFEQIADHKLRPRRIGGEVVLLRVDVAALRDGQAP